MNRLDDNIKRFQMAADAKQVPSGKQCGVRQDAQNGSSSHQGTNNNSSQVVGSQSNGQASGVQSSSGARGTSGSGCGGDDPNENQKKKDDPEDKIGDGDEGEEVDLYSDIESNEEEVEANRPPSSASKRDVRTSRLENEPVLSLTF